MTGLLLGLISVITALNMGGSGVVPAFSSSYSAGILKKYSVLILFTVAVMLGGVIAGKNVTRTLKQKFIPERNFTPRVALVILGATGLGLGIANFLKIPQSTSQTTVMAFVGVGLVQGHFLWKNLWKIIPYWFFLPLVAYYLSVFLCRQIYPATEENLWFHQIIIYLEKHWKTFSVLTGCYVALAVGSNNIANVVAPLAAAGVLKARIAVWIFGLFFGLGAIFFFRSISTVGRNIVPLGLVSASIVNGVTATLLLGSSLLGIPQSLVQLQCLATIGIACVKNDYQVIFYHEAVKKIFFVWLITPVISLLLAVILAKLFL